MRTDAIHPTDMKWLDKGVLGIEWSDNHHGVYPIRFLRLQCPCAACTDEWTGERKVKSDDVPMFIMLKDVEPVGHYALRLVWSDGHDTGLYSFTRLRQLCQCRICQPDHDPEAEQSLRSRRLL